MTRWVDTLQEFENKQLELRGWRMRDKGWRGMLEKGETELREADAISLVCHGNRS